MTADEWLSRNFYRLCTAFVLFVIAIIAVVMYGNHEKNKQAIIARNAFVADNEGKVNVLYIYPSEYKGRINGHFAVVEGINTKERLQLNAASLPVPGEVWTIELKDDNYALKEKTQ